MSLILQPDAEIKVSDAWLRLIRFCIAELPHGQITIKIVNTDPSSLISFKRSIRFDKPDTFPAEIDFIKET